jgi:DNA helicase II / ATP-dependent DNA helicase PcrA
LIDLLSDLNPQQIEAVTAPDGQVLVLAGPGSGKTRVLTHRIAWLIRERGIPPFHLLAVTFTNRAARVMQERVQNLVEGSLEGLWLGTFHSQCAKLLRREENLLPFKRNFVIFDEDDQQSLVKKAIRELNLDEKLYRPAGVLAAISNAKNQLILPEDFPARDYRGEAGRRVYKLYQEKLEQNNALDFDDLLLWAVRLLADNADIRDAYARKFEHVLVDEFQDTNTAQYELLRLLCGHHGNIFVVGDEDQSIYRWRGADYKNVLRFEKDYPACRKILLEQNYRSTRTVVETARAVIDRNTQRTHKNLFSERPEGLKITLYEAIDDHAEAAYVVDTIAQLISSKQAPGSDLAVMYRTNAQSRLLEEAFIRSGMPYRLVGAQRFYGRREIKDVIAYLRLASNPADEVSLTRAIGVPPRGIGDKTLTTLALVSQRAQIPPGEVLIDLGRNADASRFWADFKGRGAALLADFGAMLANWQKLSAEAPLPTFFDTVIADAGYQAYITDGSEEGDYRWENVMELRRLAFEFQELGLIPFLENLALVGDQDTVPERPDAPTLLTLHAAKGLEFNTVFITGLDEGFLPHSRSRDDPEEMAEERRLFYVGLTRAKDRLYLVRAEQRSGYGAPDWSSPSRFLDDIPVSLVSVKGISERSGKNVRKTDYFTTWTLSSERSAPKAAPEPVEMKYKAGMRVKNENWGEGLVMDARIQDGEERIDVFFDSVGFKRLIASMAKLEIVGNSK